MRRYHAPSPVHPRSSGSAWGAEVGADLLRPGVLRRAIFWCALGARWAEGLVAAPLRRPPLGAGGRA
eukprot:1811810-Alexandrium_andersonii.AAC.1